MENILVVAAMEEELEAFYEGLSKKKTALGGIDAYVSESEDKRILGILGGIGKVSMAFRLGRVLSQMDFSHVINVGVAGSISPKLKPLMIFVGERCAYHDVDATAMGYEIGQMCQEPKYFECDKEWEKKALTFDPKNMMPGLILSGDSFITKKNLNPSVNHNFEDPIACDMESAAVGQVCHDAKIPFLILRAISDDAGGNSTNAEQYEKLLNEASRNAGAAGRYVVLGK